MVTVSATVIEIHACVSPEHRIGFFVILDRFFKIKFGSILCEKNDANSAVYGLIQMFRVISAQKSVLGMNCISSSGQLNQWLNKKRSIIFSQTPTESVML
jgi:hypothetical protein